MIATRIHAETIFFCDNEAGGGKRCPEVCSRCSMVLGIPAKTESPKQQGKIVNHSNNCTMIKFTQGKWSTITWHTDNDPKFSTSDLHVDGVGIIAQIKHLNIPQREAEANAKLIEAAPELLESLRDILKAYREAIGLHDPNTHSDLTTKAHNVIAKAIGK
jgi:hypothetical protein